METDVKKCGIEGCNCPAAGDSGYCSSYCESAADQDLTTIGCECGHPGCEM